MTKEELDIQKEIEKYFTESTGLGRDKLKNFIDIVNKALKQKGERIAELENKIADIKANCDLAIEGRDVKIMELTEQIERLTKEVNDFENMKATLESKIAELEQQIEQMQDVKCTSCTELGGMQLKINRLEQQIEKMKNCGNCKYGYCGGSSISIDKDGNRTFHNWNEEKQAYCDIGKNGKYQCWEIEK